ncbi:AraC family transcriptional regulator [[Clostridium] polysaccharolyticum]|uniref:AraC-type DNA-binding protein n=1 Tax=[Clostridium] polysaccharolyticum TaxID=29364 RepID=A0A1I0CSK7_9FIRM|nr:helix-turn-helix domain-containing protein [[Clostridium] polysaccharolyticum]SET22334.1 AraC-type DNA-binding protein [[Clostridium] polysaccharolyticum]
MPQKATFEDLDILQTVKVIPADYFPAKFPMHWHTQVEMIYVSLEADQDATLSVNVNQDIYTLHKGDILFIWPGELHEILPNTRNSFYGIQFSPSLINNRPEFSGKYNLFCHEHLLSFQENKDTAQELLGIFDEITKQNASSDAYKGVEMLIGIYQFLIAFSRYIEVHAQSMLVSSKLLNTETIQKIHGACSYITKNCTNALTLDSVSNFAGFSPYYFSRTFKQVTGFAFTEYLSIQRIRHAQQLLSDTALSITEIAFQSGFKSIPTFNRAFKQFEGYSPSEFKELYSNQ